MTNNEKLNKAKIERIGEVRFNRYGTPMKIIDYINSKDVVVEFQDEHHYKKHTDYAGFKNGKTDNPYDKTMFGVGYRGVGKFGADKNNKKIYSVWECMMARCYADNPTRTKACYEGCVVCDEWHNFQNFAKWYEDNYYEISGQRMHIDKDILQKNNTVYSSETCVIVPNEINALMVKRKIQRGDTPIGVYYNKNMHSYVAFCWTGGVQKEYLGQYNTPQEAFVAYKTRKEQYIKEIADKYKEQIPKKLYDALYKYEVEITD